VTNFRSNLYNCSVGFRTCSGQVVEDVSGITFHVKRGARARGVGGWGTCAICFPKCRNLRSRELIASDRETVPDGRLNLDESPTKAPKSPNFPISRFEKGDQPPV
jgi:hypothetical protein